MIRLEEILTPSLLRHMVGQGYIKKQTHPDDPSYAIFNYTDKAVFDREWNEATRMARGLIVKGDHGMGLGKCEVLARPFAKFFNYGEAEAAVIAMDEPVYVTDKVDGSLGILYRAPDGRPAIATRGSFASEQALHATDRYRAKYENRWTPDPQMTYLFEIVFPANRIVVDYGSMDNLVLLGAVAKSGVWIEGPDDVADEDAWPGLCAETFEAETLRAALAMPPRLNAEGLVVRAKETGQMVKIKQDDYLRLHKIVFGLTEKSVWEALRDGKRAQDICDGIPDEFHLWVTQVASRLTRQFIETSSVVLQAYRAVRQAVDEVSTREGKKAYAMRVQSFTKLTGFKHPSMLYLLRDGKSITEAVWDSLEPKHVPYMRTNMPEMVA